MVKVITPKFCSESAYQLNLKGKVFILLLQVVSRGRVDQKQKLTRNRVIQASTASVAGFQVIRIQVISHPNHSVSFRSFLIPILILTLVISYPVRYFRTQPGQFVPVFIFLLCSFHT